MLRSLPAAALLLGSIAAAASAQQPIPLFPDAAPPRSIRPEPLPPLAPGSPPPPGALDTRSPPGAMDTRPLPPASAPPPDTPPAAAAAAAGPAETREFCSQPVGYALARRDSVPPAYRDFIGIWSDASWTPQLCAALIVENVQPDGTASILYVFGPMSSSARQTGGILRGTGVIRDGELRFQNSDGSQFAFRPLYADMDGRLTTPKGQSYQAIFKKTL
jgi:hypothetical protein